MKLFQRIFITFCTVILCSIFVASFSFWAVQTKMAESKFKQTRAMEIDMLGNSVYLLKTQGEGAVRELLRRWHKSPASRNLYVIAGDSNLDILNRPIPASEVEQAYAFALKNPTSNLVTLQSDSLGEEYLIFIRHFDHTQVERLPELIIPGLPLEPVWHEVIILTSIFVVGLLLAYILASNITKPIFVLHRGMERLATGELNTRVSQQLMERKDELASLGVQFDKMAAQLEKLVAKERHLLHHVSHEMRSPLARMQAILGLIQAQPHKQEQYLGRLENELVRMDTLVGELLTLSRLETASALEKEALPIVPFMQHLVEDSQSVAESKKHTVQLHIDNIEAHAKLTANESYLYRAFDNVIRNAMNYSPEGSTIDVNMYEDRSHLHIEICDNGPGVDESEIHKIFESFYRASSSDGKAGTGLGLALTKHIIEQHCGKIIAENRQPNGLKIHFILPKTCKKKTD